VTGASPLLGIHSRRGRRAITVGALFYAAAALALLGVAAVSGRLGTDRSSLVAVVFLLGVAISGVVVFRKLRG
jgi:hypothetical protein